MILSGLGVSLGNGLSLAILLGTGLVVYGLRIRREERMLAQALGARYEAFRNHTWAVIPFVW
jgi:protein-S-isoprenylcysteine O-methyltransferase Ste14